MAYLEGKGVDKSLLSAKKMFEIANYDGDHIQAIKMINLLKEMDH
jgi:hypothetical protein